MQENLRADMLDALFVGCFGCRIVQENLLKYDVLGSMEGLLRVSNKKYWMANNVSFGEFGAPNVELKTSESLVSYVFRCGYK